MLKGEIWWATLPQPRGSEPAKQRPVLIIQGDTFNRQYTDGYLRGYYFQSQFRKRSPPIYCWKKRLLVLIELRLSIFLKLQR
jgi:mRNA interferase MazF